MARRVGEVLTFDDLHVGDEWESPGRTVTEADVVAFAGVSGDFNALHMDHERARRGPFRRPVAHGLLGLAISTGLTSHAPRVETLAFLGIREWQFLKPIHLGDTIRVVTRVEALEARARGRRGLVTWHRQIRNQAGETVQEGTTLTLVAGRARPASEADSDEGPPAE